MIRMTLALVAATAGVASCHRESLRVEPHRYAAIHRVALVQYALNPTMAGLGTPLSDTARERTAAANVDFLFGPYAGWPFELLPLAEMLKKEAYVRGLPPPGNMKTGRGMRFFGTERDADDARLSPDMAQWLCRYLGVDGVMVIRDAWVMPNVRYIGAQPAFSEVSIKLYDRDGGVAWSDVVRARSDSGMGLARWGYYIAASVDDTVNAFNEAFIKAMRKAITRVAPVPAVPLQVPVK